MIWLIDIVAFGFAALAIALAVHWHRKYEAADWCADMAVGALESIEDVAKAGAADPSSADTNQRLFCYIATRSQIGQLEGRGFTPQYGLVGEGRWYDEQDKDGDR